ncbi:PH domain-containing protein [Phlyctema vagabunda]|uniref:PH domain-containing protein n=1 Tax=Phlyctema vagabunda TaxID=108571 RepID=A0ABR4PAQ4_9HELO
MMSNVTEFLFIYLLGGLTFLPLLIIVILSHAYLTFPVRKDASPEEEEKKARDSIVLPEDNLDALQSAQSTLAEKFQARASHEAGAAEGWFAVCREYVPGGVNGKPPERNTPVGATTVSAPSPSVYQSMYRSIFDRKPNVGPLDAKGAGRPPRKGGNVFYVVLRHGHLMLFDDDEQIEVRHVVSLAHHAVSIYSGGDETPEGELFIKRNAICLSRKLDAGEITADGTASKPFFFFSENCSDKEDFYFALLRNQERKPESRDNPPIPLQYDVKDIITLVQRLHSSEEHLQTRWINAFIGRIFLALYKTPEVENHIRAKITKKISRVKTPAFLSKIVLEKIDLGEAAPVITNPRLKDLTVDGELVVEADVRYTGNFRLEVAAIARIELGSRFKAREVNLLLAVVLKRIEGHLMLRIKPPPSNRIWLTFQTMPKIDLNIEPIVSSRQITYTLILRQIENRIKEVVAESLVYPNWDDSPFYQSDSGDWRGGIWAKDKSSDPPPDPEEAAAEEGDVDEVHHLEDEPEDSIEALPAVEKSISTPLFDTSPSSNTFARKATRSAFNLVSPKASGSSTSIESRSSATEKPRVMRSGSFASTSSPSVSTNVTHADTFKPSSPPDQAGSAMAAISALSHSTSPADTPVGSPARLSRTEQAGSHSSLSSWDSERYQQNDSISQTTITNSDIASLSSNSIPPSPGSLKSASISSEYPLAKSPTSDSRRENSNSSSSSKSANFESKRLSLAAVTNAAATAKKWGWNAIQRQAHNNKDGSEEPTDAPKPPLVMGRGRPLPPPGTPLPPPDRKTKTAPIPVPKRKPMPPPALQQKDQESAHPESEQLNRHGRRQVPPPPLPSRPSRESLNNRTGDDGLLVVAAPADSEPTSPATESTPTYMQPWVDDGEDDTEDVPTRYSPRIAAATPPRLPKRRPAGRSVSGSPEEDNSKLPSWIVAQEEEARAKSIFVDEDSGL